MKKAWSLNCLIMGIPVQLPAGPSTMMDSLRERYCEKKETVKDVLARPCTPLIGKKDADDTW